MRKIALLACLLALSSCATITRFDQTCITCVNSQRIACKGNECPTSFMIGSDCIVTIIETGENIYLNDILEHEKIAPKEGLQLTIAKINGRYFLACNEFANMWILKPNKQNTAKLKSIKMPDESMGIVTFEIYNRQLKMISQDGSKSFIFDDDKNKWIDVKQAKIGA